MKPRNRHGLCLTIAALALLFGYRPHAAAQICRPAAERTGELGRIARQGVAVHDRRGRLAPVARPTRCADRPASCRPHIGTRDRRLGTRCQAKRAWRRRTVRWSDAPEVRTSLCPEVRRCISRQRERRLAAHWFGFCTIRPSRPRRRRPTGRRRDSAERTSAGSSGHGSAQRRRIAHQRAILSKLCSATATYVNAAAVSRRRARGRSSSRITPCCFMSGSARMKLASSSVGNVRK